MGWLMHPLLILAGVGSSLAFARARSLASIEPDPAELAAEVIADPRTTLAELAQLAELIRSRRPDVATMLERAATERQAPAAGPVPTPQAAAPGIDPPRAAVARLMGAWRAAGGNDLAVIALSPSLLCEVRQALGLASGEPDTERYSVELAVACQTIDPEAPAGQPIGSGDPLQSARALCEVQP